MKEAVTCIPKMNLGARISYRVTIQQKHALKGLLVKTVRIIIQLLSMVISIKGKTMHKE